MKRKEKPLDTRYAVARVLPDGGCILCSVFTMTAKEATTEARAKNKDSYTGTGYAAVRVEIYAVPKTKVKP